MWDFFLQIFMTFAIESRKKQPLSQQHLCVLISVFDNAILEHVVMRRCIYTTTQLKRKCAGIILYQWLYIILHELLHSLAHIHARSLTYTLAHATQVLPIAKHIKTLLCLSKLRFYAFASNAKVYGEITRHRISNRNATLRIVCMLIFGKQFIGKASEFIEYLSISIYSQ